MLCASSTCRRDLTQGNGTAFLDERGHVFCTPCSDITPPLICPNCKKPIHGPMAHKIYIG
ncbi:hypothetical protein BD410DRAFT_829919, partial [Rickenella mellea]